MSPSPSPARPHSAVGERSRDLSAPLPPTLSWGVLLGFVAALASACAALGLPWWLAALYGAMSVISFAAYGIDKRAARRSGRRVPEQRLLTLGLLCGWPGSLVAQQVFHHKTRKRSFRRAFWGTVVVNVVVLVAFGAFATTIA